MQNNTHVSSNSIWRSLLKRAHMLVLIVLGGVIACSTHVGAVF